MFAASRNELIMNASKFPGRIGECIKEDIMNLFTLINYKGKLVHTKTEHRCISTRA